MTRLACAPKPCVSCPYRRDCPSGVWAWEEYEKLRGYDNGPEPALGVFQCHQSNATGDPTVCRGWLTVHTESPAARLAVLHGQVTDEERYAPPLVALFASGAAAADSGQASIAEPGIDARRMVGRLAARGAGR